MMNLMLTMLIAAHSCGTERWPVKTLTDVEAAKVDLDGGTMTTVEALRAKPAPKYDEKRARDPVELTTYTVTADVIAYKLEADSDFHVVIRGQFGKTMIAEFTAPACAAGSRVLLQIRTARFDFVRLVNARPSKKLIRLSHPLRVTITGVGFFDKIHGQTGVAPNGIELHPVLDIR